MYAAPTLRAIVTRLANKHALNLDEPGAYLRLDLPWHGQLVIENIGANRISIANYVRVFVDQPMLTFLWNSLAVATLSTLLCVFVSALAAYAIVRLRVPMGTFILSAIVLVSMFPLISLMVPLFQIMRTVELLNTWPALILPYAVLSMPVCTLVLASFFQDIPQDQDNRQAGNAGQQYGPQTAAGAAREAQASEQDSAARANGGGFRGRCNAAKD